MKKVEKVLLVCKGCNENYFVHPYREKTSKYCGYKCKGKKLICKTCNKVFFRKAYIKRQYCSQKCSAYIVFFKGHSPYVNNKGENSYAWKGQNVSYDGLHKWISRELGTPSKCEFCGDTSDRRYEWANKSREYKRDLSDWIRLCRPCHADYDDIASKGWQTRRQHFT
jgi:hypothetical protein